MRPFLRPLAPRYLLVLLALGGLSACGLGSNPLRPDGPLADCGSAPHCISSRATKPERRVAPLRYTSRLHVAQRVLVDLVAELPGARILRNEPGYVHAEITTSILRFVDDLEFEIQPDSVIHVRSSSRIGYYDFNVNRERIETLRARFNERQP
jgi:uncharacterized protein (DUF1499 family)